MATARTHRALRGGGVVPSPSRAAAWNASLGLRTSEGGGACRAHAGRRGSAVCSTPAVSPASFGDGERCARTPSTVWSLSLDEREDRLGSSSSSSAARLKRMLGPVSRARRQPRRGHRRHREGGVRAEVAAAVVAAARITRPSDAALSRHTTATHDPPRLRSSALSSPTLPPVATRRRPPPYVSLGRLRNCPPLPRDTPDGDRDREAKDGTAAFFAVVVV